MVFKSTCADCNARVSHEEGAKLDCQKTNSTIFEVQIIYALIINFNSSINWFRMFLTRNQDSFNTLLNLGSAGLKHKYYLFFQIWSLAIRFSSQFSTNRKAQTHQTDDDSLFRRNSVRWLQYKEPKSYVVYFKTIFLVTIKTSSFYNASISYLWPKIFDR